MGPAAVFQNNTKLCSESWQGCNKGVIPDVSHTWTVTKDSCISLFLLLSKRPPLIQWLMLSFRLLGKISEAPLKLVKWQIWVSGVGLPCRLSFGQLPLHSFGFILRQLHLGFLAWVFIAWVLDLSFALWKKSLNLHVPVHIGDCMHCLATIAYTAFQWKKTRKNCGALPSQHKKISSKSCRCKSVLLSERNLPLSLD